MDLIKAVVECLTGGTDQPDCIVNEKANTNYTEKAGQNAEDFATDIVNALYNAEKAGHNLERTLQNVVGECGWTENIAAAVLRCLENALKEGAPMGQAMKDAFEKATNAAVGFVHEHPVYCTIIALGILVILAPWVIQALGFGELGPIEGTFASWWQARYAGYVPKGSLFSFFQRLGMTWK
ncbi:hypothetical protein DL766_000705 [Monosporascus sp. MC13-8B]|uniref:Uncharacterized protein n=1 Tax=Monosporascus cannonballus TaxID=155416 RepID=A0ABY0H9V8_9PEZI|nr:hypothetical protein DL763_007412 [Monosporascus cannonballus]RYO88146.1 hypothetical protein DL762_003896 [Monosporascus cannonballus]RYP38896.1 hypothetical protein DL766_000705 [Monosporascus sp. MC13-8B]